MHWWHGAFASSSSSSSKSHADDDSVIRYSSSSSSSSSKSSFFSSRRNRHLQRARRLLGVTDDMCNFENSQNAREFAASPQPLPLPELHVLLRQDPKFASSNVPLPSPRDAVPVQRERGGYEDREREDGLYGDIADGFYDHMRLADQDTRTNAQYSESQFSGKSSFKRNGYERTSDRYKTHFPSSAPSSPYSSPALSPPRSDMLANHYMPPPGIFQAWSAPDMRHSDGNQGPCSYYHLPPERTSSSVEDSPIQSPTMSSSHQHPASPPRSSSPLSRMSFETSVSSGHQHSASPPRSISPLSTKMSSETSMGRRESSSQATVHPLPLPPGAAMSSQTTPISPVSDFSGANIPSQPASVSPVASKPELVPMKSQWQKGKLIGRGTFMSVYVASNRETGALCAMKEVEILPDDSKYAENMRHLEQEIKVLSRLKHPNIVQYFGSEIVGDKFYIYLEYVHPGSINKFIQDHCGAITESVVRNFTRHILCGLAYLHSKKTIHRDIKGANLLVDAYGVVKLADFGMAKHLSGQAADLSLKGSPYWLAPELLQSVMQKDTSSDVALAVDIWSLGCTIIEMMNGKPPWSEYEGAAALFKVLQETPPIPESLSADGKDFLQRCFRRNPADRPTASQLLDHPFLNYSNQPDACTQSLPDMRLLENMQLLRDRSNQTSDQVPASFDTQIKNGKPSHNETPVRLANNNHHQTQHLTMGFLPSPRSTLEALPTLSPQDTGQHSDSPNTPASYQRGADL